uniref:Dephospho-CoA kinase n=1 Tax=Romanomermis culicivorax TaxID=13658 RepID=A0A915ISY4_ROMCU
ARTSKCESGPFLIGLTGGVCSGKTHIAAYLSDFGAYVIDCDKLGHDAYAVGTYAYKKIVDEFGPEIIDIRNNNAINRIILGAKVFSNKDNLVKLNAIVWPEIRRLARERINDAKSRHYKIVVLDAAVLLEAGWQDMVHEIWTCIVPIPEVN